MCVCACVLCACVCACVRACVRACVEGCVCVQLCMCAVYTCVETPAEEQPVLKTFAHIIKLIHPLDGTTLCHSRVS